MSLKKLIPVVRQFDPLRVSREEVNSHILFQGLWCLERDGWLTRSKVAALVTFRCLATAAKAVNCVNVMPSPWRLMSHP